MRTISTSRPIRLLLAATLACAPMAERAAAGDHRVTVSTHVDTAGLDPSRPADAQELYDRIRSAAEFVCGRADRVDLAPSDHPQGCYEKALGNAIRTANLPLLTQIYLSTHTLQQALAHGIQVPPELAAR